MAVTTKTLTPTNQVVTLPDMTEKPNASVLVDGIGKEADAINALNSKIATVTGNQIGVIKVVESRAYGHTLYFPAYVGEYGISFNVITTNENVLFYLYLAVASNGTITKNLEKMSVNGAAGINSNYCAVSMKQ